MAECRELLLEQGKRTDGIDVGKEVGGDDVEDLMLDCIESVEDDGRGFYTASGLVAHEVQHNIFAIGGSNQGWEIFQPDVAHAWDEINWFV